MIEALPIFIYDKSLNDLDVPYTVTVNEPGIAAFLSHYGLSREQVNKTKIKFSKRPWWDLLPQGRYNHFTKTICIYPDRAWDKYIGYSSLASSILEGAIAADENQFNDILYTKKLSSYLETCAIKNQRMRASEFADRLLTRGMNRQLNHILHHEIKHSIDDQKNPALMMLSYGWTALTVLGIITAMSLKRLIPTLDTPVLGGLVNLVIDGGIIVTGLTISYGYDPAETSARRFAKKYENDPQWSYLVSLKSSGE